MTVGQISVFEAMLTLQIEAMPAACIEILELTG